ncbi:hypothetical protein [Paenibacillus sp. YPG26]|uniref:hypothetical protein n=1 Tax=Paenibacillus sp. YPG26 TaxID=2878915 RepID=UPI0020421559|nr:hypothetical protein [Paenibacillus sp. YPG26]USB34907.1 hypothetical protein LDO05_09215 [Paenibacillus sp. YPG26]
MNTLELKQWLIWIGIGSGVGFLSLIIALRVIHRNEQTSEGYFAFTKPAASSSWVHRYKVWMLICYQNSMKVPVLRTYIHKIRKRIAGVNIHNEFDLRIHTMTAALCILGTYGFSITILYSLNPDFIYLLTLILTAIILNSMFLDSYIHRLEKKLLLQMVDYFTEVRHAYHRHGIVEEALYDAAEIAEEEIARHGFAIADALVSTNPADELDKYYETSPSRFLKSFAGISFLIMEYGDKVKKEGSIYLKALSSLTQEIHLDIIRRNKLDYLLKGLHFIALIPVFFTKPIELWARRSFPLMEDYYLGKYGLLTKIVIYVIIILAYIMLQKLTGVEEKNYVPKPGRAGWEQTLYENSKSGKLVNLFIPGSHTISYLKMSELLRDTNHPLKVEWMYIRRIVLFIGAVLITLGCTIFLHSSEKARIVSESPRESIMLGSSSRAESTQHNKVREQDRKWINRLNGSGSAVSYEQVSRIVATDADKNLTEEQLKAIVSRIMDKFNRLNHEYLKWWEVLLSLGIGWLGYCCPLWMLYFQRRIRAMDMKHEVYQFQTMITILRELERISVEEILEWMHAYSVIFRTPIEKCLLHYEHGAEASLQSMKEESALPEFTRLTEKLLLAVEKIPIAQAFDDLESEMAFRFEQRRLDYEKMLETKAGLGRVIGFTPMYALIFMYLVIPLIWMSFTQMSQYYDQIQKI